MSKLWHIGAMLMHSAEDQYVAVEGGIELSDLVPGPTNVALDLEAGLGAVIQPSSIVVPSNRTGGMDGGDSSGSSNRYHAGGIGDGPKMKDAGE